ncbi:MAG: mercuric transporter MerT family protein [Methylocystis sp.]
MTIDATRLPDKPGPSAPATGWFAGVGAAFGLGALAASSCCALPLALASLGVSAAVFGGFLETLASLRPYLLGGAALALVVGWALFFRRRAVACDAGGACATPVSSKRTATLLGVGTLVIGMASVWQPYVEPILLKLMR